MRLEKEQIAKGDACPIATKDRSRTSLRLMTLVVGVVLAGTAALATGDATTSSPQATALSPEAVVDAVGVDEKKNKFNELGRHVDYEVELHEGTNMAAYPSPNGGQIVISIQGGLWITPVGSPRC